MSINAPLDGAVLLAGSAVLLDATATDSEDDDLGATIAWTSNLDGALGHGAQLTTTTLSVGTHVLTAAVLDRGGRSGDATVTVSIEPATRSFPAIADTTVAADSAKKSLGAEADLAADVDPARLALLRFAVSGLGEFRIAQARVRLTVGPISNAASDVGGTLYHISDGRWSETTTYLNRPAIDGPALSSVGRVRPNQVVDFDVTSAVAGDGMYDFALLTSSGDGVRYQSREAQAGRPQLIVTLEGANVPPEVNVVAPDDGAIVLAGAPILLDASAVDREDGDLGAAVSWTSSLDGPLGTGSRLSVSTLSVGTHLLTATVSDARGAMANATVTLTVSQSTLAFNPVADTYVDKGDPSVSFGTLAEINADASPVRMSFLRFNLAGIAPFAVQQARVRLTVSSQKGSASDSAGTLYGITSGTWDEATTYKTRPVVDGMPLASAGAVATGQSVDFDVTRFVQGDGEVNFALLTASSKNVRYRSRESGSARPQLVVTLKGNTANVGYQDLVFGDGIDQTENKATSQKPESKLWYHDGTWWGVLYNPAAAAFRIHSLNAANQSWVDTGELVDQRPHSRQDVLWDGTHLWIASRFAGRPPMNRVLRYSWVAATRAWQIDAGFPVDVPGGGSESLTIAKDSTGALWITYTLGSEVFVSSSTDGGFVWGTPFVVPVAPHATVVEPDDISSVIAMPGAMGVFWSNQVTDAFYFAQHRDGAPADEASAWTLETVGQGSNLADDHMNAKLASDGRLFVAVKTSHSNPGATLVGLYVRSTAGTWSPLYKIADLAFNPTRPICLLDEVARRVFVFYSTNFSAIFYKSSSLDQIAFPGGNGTPFIASTLASDVNNPTSTKQNVTPATGIAVLASSSQTASYWHNTITPK